MTGIRIEAPSFVAGAIAEGGCVVEMAPILFRFFALGQSIDEMERYSLRRGWAVHRGRL